MVEGQAPLVNRDDRVFTLLVALREGPVSEAFLERHPVITRTLQMRGDHSLRDFHRAIFAAFDRQEEQFYEFQIGGIGPKDPPARRYVLPEDLEAERLAPPPAGTVDTALGALGLRAGEVFGYWFDFGDEWRHHVHVERLDERAEPGAFPRLIQRVGESPPQYLDGDEEGSDRDERKAREEPRVPDAEHLERLLHDVPKARRERLAEVLALIDAFCAAHLNDEYQWLSREAAAGFCDADAQILKGKPEGWAAGVVHAMGRVNFLGDAASVPFLSTRELAQGFGVSPATMAAKARVVEETLELVPLHPDWCLLSLLDDNPLVWVLHVNGMMMDIRTAPRGAQVEAYRKGLIPYIPADRRQNGDERPATPLRENR